MPWCFLTRQLERGSCSSPCGLRKEVSAEAKLKAELKKDYLQAKAWLKSQLKKKHKLDQIWITFDSWHDVMYKALKSIVKDDRWQECIQVYKCNTIWSLWISRTSLKLDFCAPLAGTPWSPSTSSWGHRTGTFGVCCLANYSVESEEVLDLYPCVASCSPGYGHSWGIDCNYVIGIRPENEWTTVMKYIEIMKYNELNWKVCFKNNIHTSGSECMWLSKVLGTTHVHIQHVLQDCFL